MRAFEIYVKDKKAQCDVPKMHVRADTVERFPVYLRSGLETKYKLENLIFSKNPKGALTQDRLNDTAIMLKDKNESPGAPKFSVRLTAKGSNPKVGKLDPIIVNED